MRNFKLVLTYDGSDFHGWQTQPKLRTVQQVLESALADFTGESRVRVIASGRTDAGVHAVQQVANFHSATTHTIEIVRRAVNARLPDDLVIRSVEEVPLAFDANRDAKRKLYRYVIHDGRTADPFLRRLCWHCRYQLDAVLMREAAEVLRGTHDFACFESEWPNRASSVRTILHVSVNRVGEWLWLDVEADGFLYNMVRAIAGTLMYVGRGFWPVDYLAKLIESKDRTQAGPTAPPQGLFLMRVSYE